MSHRDPLEPGAALHPTRQQIEELDSLIQRMLELPVTEEEDELQAEKEQKSATTRFFVNNTLQGLDSPGGALIDSIPHAPDVPIGEETGEDFQESDLAHSNSNGTGNGFAQQEVGAENAKAIGKFRASGSKSVPSYPSTSALVAPIWVRPFIWCNQAFDWTTALLGPPGRWLQSGIGRTILGLIGFGLLGIALARAVFLWTGWPR